MLIMFDVLYADVKWSVSPIKNLMMSKFKKNRHTHGKNVNDKHGVFHLQTENKIL